MLAPLGTMLVKIPKKLNSDYSSEAEVRGGGGARRWGDHGEMLSFNLSISILLETFSIYKCQFYFSCVFNIS